MGALFVPTVIAKIVAHRYGLVEVSEVESVRERFYAISAERRLKHPAVVAMTEAARSTLFDRAPAG